MCQADANIWNTEVKGGKKRQKSLPSWSLNPGFQHLSDHALCQTENTLTNRLFI